MANEYRVTAFYIEALDNSSGAGRVTTFPIEVLHSGQLSVTPVRVSTYPLEVLHGGQISLAFIRVTLLAIEVLRSTALATFGKHAAQIIG